MSEVQPTMCRQESEMPDYLQNRSEFCEGTQTQFSITDNAHVANSALSFRICPITSTVSIMRYLQPCEIA